MPNKHLATYTNDHVAGSVAALELLQYIASVYAGTEAEGIAKTLWEEVAADRKELEDLMGRLQIAQSAPRNASAWLAEKLTQLKLRLDDPAGGMLRLLEATDAVSIGVEGKRLLWRSLSAAAEADPALRGCDYDRLIRRAEDQRQRLEALRLRASKAALAEAAELPPAT